MDSKVLEGHVRLITDGGIRITLRRATPDPRVTSEIDAFIPLAVIMSPDLVGKVLVRADWVAENLGDGLLGPQPTIEAPKAGPVALDKSPTFRRLMMKYHPDTARGGLFTASEIAADLNALADSLKYDRKGE